MANVLNKFDPPSSGSQDNKFVIGGTTQINALAVRQAGDYSYLYKFSDTGDGSMTGGVAQKTYLIGLFADRPAGSAATGDSNDALVRASFNNYAANDTNFIMRGINFSINNRSGGTLGFLDNQLGCQGKSGGTVGTIKGLTVIPENYGTVSDLFGGIDIVLKNEGVVATEEFGIKIRNINNSTASKVGSAVLIEDTGTNTGFTSGIDMSGATLTNIMVTPLGTKITESGDDIVFTNAGATKSVTITMV